MLGLFFLYSTEIRPHCNLFSEKLFLDDSLFHPADRFTAKTYGISGF